MINPYSALEKFALDERLPERHYEILVSAGWIEWVVDCYEEDDKCYCGYEMTPKGKAALHRYTK